MPKQPEKKVTGDDCARELGVGQPTVIAVRKMLGMSGARKVFVEPVRKFLKRYPDFQIRDSTPKGRAAFHRRHPEFTMPDDTHANLAE